MKKIIAVMVCVASVLLLSSCGNSPRKVAKGFAENLAKGNVTEAKKYATPSTQSLIDMAASMGAIEAEPDFKFVVVDEVVEGNRATVTIEGGKEFDLVKIDGKWLVQVNKDAE